MAKRPRTALITGASTGIGRTTALHLDRRGMRVFATVRREEDADSLRRDASDRLRPLFLDVTDGESIAATVDAVTRAVGDAGLDGLVNNAGIAVGGPLELLPIDAFRRQFEVNVVGQLAVTQAVLPAIRRARGRIVNVGSVAGRATLPLVGAYAASKHALEAMTDALRMELRHWGVQVAIVEPGAVRTPIWERSVAAVERMLARLPERARSLYGPLIDGIMEFALRSAETGIPPERVAKAIEHALTVARPRTRYLIGRDARARALLQKLPDRLRDRIIAARLRRLTRAAAADDDTGDAAGS
ncbi:MAG: SDR family oxidoreductase [Gemmatimonadota bacterium]